jgi:amino acid permease
LQVKLVKNIGLFMNMYLISLVLLFLIATLGESGTGKVLDWSGNRAYFSQQFKSTPLAGTIGVFFPLVTLMELATAVLSLLGLWQMWLSDGSTVWAIRAVALGSLTFIALIFGQRMAKDYAGAAGIVPYLIVVLLGLLAGG